MRVKQPGTILIVDDEEDINLSLKLLLRPHYKSVFTETNPYHLPRLLRQYEPDVVLLDMNFSKGKADGAEGLSWLKKVRELRPATHVIMITAYSDVSMAVEAIKSGAADFVEKPWRNEKLISTVRTVYELSQSQTKLHEAQSVGKLMSETLDQPFSEIVGTSKAMQHVMRMVDKVALTDANVLILGENGTGKEVIARAIHRKSARSHKVFVAADMGAITESLFLIVMFGYPKGAFTGAIEERSGRFQLAHGGTLFLDEIGNIPLSMQPKLLQALQTHTIMPVGSDKPVHVDIRVICATNQPLKEMIAKGTFREDLLYRINTVEIRIPALRERGEDIDLLTDHFLQVYARKYRKDNLSIDASLRERIREYPWPGNVRELRHMVERAVILCDGEVITRHDFQLHETPVLTAGTFNLMENEKKLVVEALEKYEGNISKAAQALGLTRAALYRRLEKFGMHHQ
jgi:DNA-binding NtrC family response regulator